MTPEDDERVDFEKWFPEIPERLAQELGVTVITEPLQTRHGWCVRGKAATIIRINSNDLPVRRRFTLAHEIAHLAEDDKLEKAAAFDWSVANKGGERAADGLAAELLIPLKWLKAVGLSSPICPKDVKRIAGKANVSLVTTAYRIVSTLNELGLGGIAAVVEFHDDDTVSKKFVSKGTLGSDESVTKLLLRARLRAPDIYRSTPHNGHIVTAGQIETPYSTILFCQRLPAEDALAKTIHEKDALVEDHLFSGDASFKARLSGQFGYFNGRNRSSADPAAAVREFREHYKDKWSPTERKTMASAEATQWLAEKFRLAKFHPKHS